MNTPSSPAGDSAAERFTATSVAIIGVGLIGGSIARTIARLDPRIEVRGFARSDSSAQTLSRFDWLDRVETDLPTLCRDVDVVVVTTPVDRIASLVNRCAELVPPSTLITDGGSTKSIIAGRTAGIANFIAAHPIAGSERSGPESAMDDLFDGKLAILTPSSAADPKITHRCESFWRWLGCRVISMTPEDHDAQLAAVSHVPHLIASLVAANTPGSAAELVGSGWRDITRVAGGDAEMWTAIVQQNGGPVAEHLRALRDDLQSLIDNLHDPAAVGELLRRGQQAKHQIDAAAERRES